MPEPNIKLIDGGKKLGTGEFDWKVRKTRAEIIASSTLRAEYAKGQQICENGVWWECTQAVPTEMGHFEKLVKDQLAPGEVVVDWTTNPMTGTGYLLDTGVVSTFNQGNYAHSEEYKPILSDTRYKRYGRMDSANAICFYDRNKNFITGINPGAAVDEFEFTTPEGCFFYRDSLRITDQAYIDAYKVEVAETSSVQVQEKSTKVIAENANNWPFANLSTIKPIFKEFLLDLKFDVELPEPLRIYGVSKASDGSRTLNLNFRNGNGDMLSYFNQAFPTIPADGIMEVELKEWNSSGIAGTAKVNWNAIAFDVTYNGTLINGLLHPDFFGSYKQAKEALAKVQAYGAVKDLKPNSIIIDEPNSDIAANQAFFKSDGTLSTFSPAGWRHTELYIPVLPSTDYKYTGALTNSTFNPFYNAKKQVVGAFAGSGEASADITTEELFTTPADCFFIRCSCYDIPVDTFKIEYVGNTPIIALEALWQLLYQKALNELNKTDIEATNEAVTGIDQRVTVLEGGSPNLLDLDVFQPAHLFGIDNDADTTEFEREYITQLYPESLVKGLFIQDLALNNKRVFPFQTRAKNSSAKQEHSFSYSISAPNYNLIASTVKLVKTRSSNAKDKSIRVLDLGDSLTATDATRMDGQVDGIGGRCYTWMAQQMAVMDNADHGDDRIKYLSVGTQRRGYGTSPAEGQFAYKGTTYDLRHFNEGRGSWSAASFLRHPAQVSKAGDTSWYKLPAPAAWQLAGFVTQYGRECNNDTADYQLLGSSVIGFYAHDYGQELFDFFKSKSYWTGTQTWTDVQADYDAIDAAVTQLYADPINKFYDKTKAASGADNAFSLQTYLDRNKTLADDGVTRLTVGVDAGTLVTNNTQWDVCTPTHFTCLLGTNDQGHHDHNGVTAADTCKDIVQVVQTEFPAIICAMGGMRKCNPLQPENWSDVGTFNAFSPGSNDENAALVEELISYLGSLSTQASNKRYYLPIYHCFTPCSTAKTRQVYDPLNNATKLAGCDDGTHNGYAAQWEMALQLLAWLYYTL